jgi:hypothetical protein
MTTAKATNTGSHGKARTASGPKHPTFRAMALKAVAAKRHGHHGASVAAVRSWVEEEYGSGEAPALELTRTLPRPRAEGSGAIGPRVEDQAPQGGPRARASAIARHRPSAPPSAC